MALSSPPGGPPATPATVYRDVQGVPHITAANEAAAWYALGFEQARDGLLWIQYACKAAKGELFWLRGDPRGLQNDIAVKVLGAHLGGKTTFQLQQMFTPLNSAIQANFYDNCSAYAAGANAYRSLVSAASTNPPLTPEGALRVWFDSTPFGARADLKWVYETAIDPKDIASQGAWVSATWSMYGSDAAVLNSIGSSYTLQGGAEEVLAPDLLVDPLAPEHGARLLEQMRQYVSGLPGGPSAMSGSNSFAWAGLHCIDPATSTEYPGLLADPHQGLPFYGPNFTDLLLRAPNHMWFAHVQVTPPGTTQPSLDVFGHVPYAAAAFQSSHNRTLAVGGTAGAPNHTDRFVLRLREDPATGNPTVPHEFYSYYHDTPGPNQMGTNTTYQPITAHSVGIKQPNGSNLVVPYWRAQSFGLILPDLLGQMPVVFGDRVETNQAPPPWRARVPGASANPSRQPLPKMRFWKYPERDANQNLITSPMVVTVRTPMDSAVAGEAWHSLLMRDFWEISHATTVTDVIPYTNGAVYNVNVCIADNNGSIFTTQLSKIPERGDDAALQADQYSSLDKWLIYSGGAGPVPARHYRDRKFDWRFGNYTNPVKPAPLQYLEYPPNFVLPTPLAAFKPATLQIAAPPQAFPPPNPQTPTVPGTTPGQTFKIEGGLFASACNDQIWGYSRKTDRSAWATTNGYAWRDIDTDNYLLDWVLEAGCAYQSDIVTFAAPDQRQNIVVERFTRQAQHYHMPGNSWALPPLTPAQMREFVVTPRLFSDPNYEPPQGASADISLPTPVRQLREVLNNSGYLWINPLDPIDIAEDPVQRANKEMRFFHDFWEALATTQLWSSHTVQPGLVVDLHQLWALGGDPSQPTHASQVFWYDDPTVPNPTVRWIDMPPELPLIDFDWAASDLGHSLTLGGAWNQGSILNGVEQNAINTLVTRLEAWDPGVGAADRYRMDMTRDGARVLGMLRVGYNATGSMYGRHWTSRRLLAQGPTPTAEYTSWESLRELALPSSQGATLLKGGLNPPYDALYDNFGQPNQAVKATLTPANTNALVEFFLRLGGHYIDPDHNNDNPSRKFARWQASGSNASVFLGRVPASYPLTGGLERITVLRRLLETDAYLGSLSQPIFRARAYDHYGQQLWPDPVSAQDADCVGEALRSVVWFEEPVNSQGHVPNRGFQPKFLGMAGSYATLLTLFPRQGVTSLGVESYFWCTPGVQAMGNDLRGPAQTAQRFDQHMQAFASNTLMQSHFNDFLTNHVTVVTHYY